MAGFRFPRWKNLYDMCDSPTKKMWNKSIAHMSHPEHRINMHVQVIQAIKRAGPFFHICINSCPPCHSNPLWALWHTSSHEVHRILELNMAVFKFSPSYPSVSAISQSCQKLALWTQPLVQPYAFPSLLAAASSDRKAFDDALPGPCGILSGLRVEGICDRIF